MNTGTWIGVAAAKPKKRAIPIPIQNKKLFVLGFDITRVITIPHWDVTYEHIPKYDLNMISLRFNQQPNEFENFAFIASESDDTLKTITQKGVIEMKLQPQLLKDWQQLMGETSPHYSYFCIDRPQLYRLEAPQVFKLKGKWENFRKELKYVVDERNMILV